MSLHFHNFLWIPNLNTMANVMDCRYGKTNICLFEVNSPIEQIRVPIFIQLQLIMSIDCGSLGIFSGICIVKNFNTFFVRAFFAFVLCKVFFYITVGTLIRQFISKIGLLQLTLKITCAFNCQKLKWKWFQAG